MDRVADLEVHLQRIYSQVGNEHNQLESKFQELQGSVVRERGEREQANQRLKDLLEGLSVGGLDLETVGLLWLLLGVTLSTVPSELTALWT